MKDKSFKSKSKETRKSLMFEADEHTHAGPPPQGRGPSAAADAKQDVFLDTQPPPERVPEGRSHTPQPIGAASKQDVFLDTLPPSDPLTDTMPYDKPNLFLDQDAPPEDPYPQNNHVSPPYDEPLLFGRDDDAESKSDDESDTTPDSNPDTAPTKPMRACDRKPAPRKAPSVALRSDTRRQDHTHQPETAAVTDKLTSPPRSDSALGMPPTGPTAILPPAKPKPKPKPTKSNEDPETNTNAQDMSGASAQVKVRYEKRLEDMIGRQIGAYVIEEELGRGGMGAVYLASRSDDEFNMKASVKLIHRKVASDDMLENFRRERQILADLRHPHICSLLDGGATEDGFPYFLMEYIQGRTIAKWCKINHPSLLELIRMFSKIVGALGFAHAAGITHRDIKPGNLLVTDEGEPKLLDFGIAGLVDKKTGFVQSDFVAMTPEYASPEQMHGEPLSPQTDIYSLGILFMEILRGERPRTWAGNPQEMVRLLMAEGLPNIGAGRAGDTTLAEPIPEVLGYLLRTMLADDEDKRYASMKDVAQDLDRAMVKLLLDSTTDATGERVYDTVPWYHPGDLSTVLQHMAYLSENEDLRIWFDQWDVTAGATVITSFIAALKKARTCLVYIGANEQHPWQTNVAAENALAALAARGVIRIIPVLLPGAGYPKRQSELPAFVRGRAWFSFEDISQEEGLERIISGILGQPVGRDTITGPTVCPFRGLEVFRPEDRRFFHGREALTQQLLQYLESHGFQAVVGPSGSGKSSVVQAGVIPELLDNGHLVALFTPRAMPLDELAFSLRRQFADTLGEQLNLLNRLRQSEEALHYLGRELVEDLDDKRLFLVIDQFEEVFTMAEDPLSRDAFIANLCYTASQADSKISIIITMRSDFIGRCAQWPLLNNLVSDHFVQVGPMTRLELEQAIEEPARLGNLRLERGLLDRILDEVTGAATELPLLEHALLELYERRRGNMLTMQGYTDIGGIQGALARRAESEYEALNDNARNLLRRMFVMALITPGQEAEDTRRHATREELLALDEDRNQVETLLKRMINARLLTGAYDAVRNGEIIDVAHEALIRRWDRIKTWMDESRELSRAVNQLRQAAASWEESGHDKDLLPRGGPLQRLVDLVDVEGNYLGQSELVYVETAVAVRDSALAAKEAARQKELQKARRQTMRTRLAAGVFVLMVTGFAALIWQESQLTQAAYKRAEYERTIAEQEREAAQQTADFLETIFAAADRSQKGEVKAADLLSQGRRMLDQEPDWLKKGLLPVIANAYRGLGDLETAGELITQAQEMLTPSDPAKLRVKTLANLAIIETERGNLEQSAEASEAALALARNMLTPDMVEFRTALFAAARSATVMGELVRAEALTRELIALKLNQPTRLEEANPAKEYEDLAGILHRRGNMAETETYLKKALELRQTRVPENQAGISRVLRGLADLYTDQGDHAKAEPVYRKILASDKALLGEAHPRVLAALSSLGLSLKYQKRYAESEAVLREALGQGKATYGDQHPRVASILGNLAGLKYDQGDYQAAQTMQEEALAIKQANLGENHYSVGTTLLYLAGIHLKDGDAAQAEARTRRALSIYEKALGPTHPFVISALNSLGEVLAQMGRYEEAEPHLQRAQQIADSKLKANHQTRHQLNSTHGLVMAGLGRFGEAEAMMLESFAALKEQNPNKAVRAQENLIRAYELVGREKDAAAIRAER